MIAIARAGRCAGAAARRAHRGGARVHGARRRGPLRGRPRSRRDPAREGGGGSERATVLALGRARPRRRTLASLAEIESAEPFAIDRPPASLAQILYTSGTTGHPKGVTHSYASVAAAMGAWASTFGVGPDDRLLGQLALSHFGGRAMDACWVAGATLVILPAADPKAMLGASRSIGVTMILVIPTLLRMLLDHPDAAGRTSRACAPSSTPPRPPLPPWCAAPSSAWGRFSTRASARRRPTG